MKQTKFLFVLFILLQYPEKVYPQEISFYYDEISDSLFPQSNTDQLIENLRRQIWNETLTVWENDSLYEHSYNGNNLVDTIIAHKWRNGSVWGNDLKAAYSYNTHNKIILKSFSEWMLSNWYENTRYQYIYSGLNQNLSWIYIYFFSSNIWYVYGYDVYSWKANNCLTRVIKFVSSTIFPNTYVPTWQDSFYYNLSNQLIMKTGFDAYGGWVPEVNDLYFYDNVGNKAENVRQVWNNTDSIWINYYRYLYEYDVNNVVLSIVYQNWQQDSLAWENVWRETYTYTPQNKIATMLKETWSPETSWNNNVLRNYFYDTNYNWVESITYLWNETSWENYYRHLATWIEPVSVWETPAYLEEYYLSNNYPNPFNPSTKIKFEIPTSGFVTLKVYDILGKEVAIIVNEEKPSGEYEIEFSGTGLPSGIYFYTLTASGFSKTKKMILLK